MKTQQKLYQKQSDIRDISTHINFAHNIPGYTRPILTWQVTNQNKFFGILRRLSSLNLLFLEVAFVEKEGETHA
jgi:hypothetical protein